MKIVIIKESHYFNSTSVKTIKKGVQSYKNYPIDAKILSSEAFLEN